MIANHIHDAIHQIQQLQELVLARKKFKGYSGTARITGGLVALCGTLLLSSRFVPKTNEAQLIGWGVILLGALTLNYGALLIWFLFDREICRDYLKLSPAFDAFPALGVGAVLSLALILKSEYNLLFGVWMCLYGLVHVVYKISLPKSVYGVGLFYIFCGAYCLLDSRIIFTNPLPMGTVFFIGEITGGYFLYKNRQEINE